MRKIFLLVFAALLFFAPCVQAANDVDHVAGSYCINLSSLDSNWAFTDTITNRAGGIRIFSITFNPGATGDEAYFRDVDTSGTVIFKPFCSSVYEQKCKTFGGKTFELIFDFDSSTISAGASIVIILDAPGG